MERSLILNTLQDAKRLRMQSGYHGNFVGNWASQNNFECHGCKFSTTTPEITVSCVHDALKFLFDFGEHLCRRPDHRWQLMECESNHFSSKVMLMVYSITEECRPYGQPRIVDIVHLEILDF